LAPIEWHRSAPAWQTRTFRQTGEFEPLPNARAAVEACKRAEELWDAGRLAEAVECYRNADAVLWALPGVEDIAHAARNGLTAALMELGRYKEALEAVRGVIDRFGVETKAEDRLGLTSSSVSEWLFLLDRLGYTEDADVAAQSVLNARGRDAVPHGGSQLEQEVVADAFRLRGIAAHRRGDREGAIAFFDQAIASSETRDAPSGASQDQTDNRASIAAPRVVAIGAKAMTARARVLAELGRTEEAVTECAAIIDRFGSAAEDPRLKSATAIAHRLQQSLLSS
jgi:tetratricopeptide (TPR) repeat protein